MKIVHIVLGKANTNRPNGVNQVVDALACYLPTVGIDTEIWGITESPEAKTPKRKYTLRLFRKLSYPFVITKNMHIALVNLPVETVVHFHGVMIPCFFRVAMILNEIGIKYVVSPHSALSSHALKRHSIRKKIYINIFERYFLNSANVVHSLTLQESIDIQRITHKVPVVTIPNGIEVCKPIVHEFNKKTKTAFGYIGRIEIYQKGLDLLIDAFNHYKNNGGNGCLIIIGSGPDEKWLKQRIVKLGLEGSVSYLGPVFGSKLQLLRKTIHFQIQVSRWEGVSMSMLEAIANGIPLIASKGTNMGGDICKYSAGWVVSNGSIIETSSAMKEAELQIVQGNYMKYQVAAYKLASNKFNWNNIVKSLKRSVYLYVG